MRAMLRSKLILCCLGISISTGISAQKRGGGDSELNSDYTIEIMPFVAKNLPYDLWGTPGMMNALGARGSIRLANEKGALEGSAFYHHAGPDNAYSIEAAYRHEVYSAGFLNGYFAVGLHVSVFNLEADRDSDGNCVLTGCLTDSGTHYGLSYGGGIMLPVGQYPIKLGLRFYQNPQSWLLLEAGYGFRF